MTFIGPPCTCEGLNTDCSRCHGTGVVQPQHVERSSFSDGQAPESSKNRKRTDNVALEHTQRLKQHTSRSRDWLSNLTMRYIVVLPFANVTRDDDDQVLADGLSETLASSLAQLERFHSTLRVVPASDVCGRISSVEDARRTFGVTLAISGSIQRLPATLRLTLNLSDAERLTQIATRTIDIAPEREVIEQDTLHSAVIALLALKLEPMAREALVAGGTTAAGAYEPYVMGRGYMQRIDRGVENIDRAIKALNLAVTRDPRYVLAHTALGEAYCRRYDVARDAIWLDRAAEHGETARIIDSRCARVHIALAMIARSRGRYEEAADFAHRAVELDPISSDAYRELGRVQEALQRPADAQVTYRKMIAVRPDRCAAGAHPLTTAHRGSIQGPTRTFDRQGLAIVVGCHKPMGPSTRQCLSAMTKRFPGLIPLQELTRNASGLLVCTNRPYVVDWLMDKALRAYWVRVEGEVRPDITHRVRTLEAIPDGLRRADIAIIYAEVHASELIVCLPINVRGIRQLMNDLGHPVLSLRVVNVAGLDLGALQEGRVKVFRFEEIDAAFSAFPRWTELRSEFQSRSAAPAAPCRKSRHKPQSGRPARKAQRAMAYARKRQPPAAARIAAEVVATGRSGRRSGFNNMGQYFPDVFDSRDSMDATKHTHVVREQGKFGSHPIHDRFDDESDA